MDLSRRPRSAAAAGVSLKDTLVAAGLSGEAAAAVDSIPHKYVAADPKRPLREIGTVRDEVLFVSTGILAKVKPDGAGRRQIVALRFPGEGILPSDEPANFAVQAVVKSEVRIAGAEDFHRVVDSSAELRRFFWRLVHRNEAIGYEWLVNCGRRNSTARVAHLLCETATRSGIDGERETMVNPFTQQQIADITGQTSVNVNRVFAELERQGLIERSGRNIAFRDWRELRRIASFHSTYLD